MSSAVWFVGNCREKIPCESEARCYCFQMGKDEGTFQRKPDIERVHAAANAIRQVLQEHRGGNRNERALSEINRLADDALYASAHQGLVPEHVNYIKGYADDLYSARKW